MPEEEEEDVEAHYDASKEVRGRGVGFYQFSKDNEVRRREMEELERERGVTERERGGARERKVKRRREVEERKEEIRRRKRGRVGGEWLEGFVGEMVGREEGGGLGGGEGVETVGEGAEKGAEKVGDAGEKGAEKGVEKVREE